MKSASDFLTTAAEIVSGPRANTHGDAYLNFRNTADLWNAYLKAKFHNTGNIYLTPTDIGELLSLFKKARKLTGAYNPDDWVDDLGYAAIAAELAAAFNHNINRGGLPCKESGETEK